MVIYYFEEPSAIFMKYYALITFVLAVFSIGFVGIPYIREGDIASPSKSFYLSMAGLAVVFLFGALVVFLMNTTPEMYITIVSAITMLFVYGSTLFGTKETVEVPRIMKELLGVLLLGILFATLGYTSPLLAAKFPALATPLRMIETSMPVLLWGMLAYLIYAGLRELATIGRAPTKPVSEIPYYEPYQNQTSTDDTTVSNTGASVSKEESTTARLTRAIRDAIAVLEQDLETLTDQGESTCSIVRDVETGYVGARSAPESDDEYSLPEDQVKARRDKRQLKAANAFRNNRKLFTSLRSSNPMLECFADPPPSNPEEEELREAIQELQGMLENTEVIAGINKADQIQIALAFSEKILDRGDKEEFQNATTAAAEQTSMNVSTLSGSQLESAARALLQRAVAVHDKVLLNEKTLGILQERVNKQVRKGGMVARGDYSGVGVLGSSSKASTPTTTF
jgi:hypothetical protein